MGLRETMNIKEWYKESMITEDWGVNSGWVLLVKNLCENIMQIDDTVEIIQVKQKFGNLRFYCSNNNSQKIVDLIRLAEMTSSGICEICGDFDRVSTEGTSPYIQSLCAKCRKNIK